MRGEKNHRTSRLPLLQIPLQTARQHLHLPTPPADRLSRERLPRPLRDRHPHLHLARRPSAVNNLPPVRVAPRKQHRAPDAHHPHGYPRNRRGRSRRCYQRLCGYVRYRRGHEREQGEMVRRHTPESERDRSRRIFGLAATLPSKPSSILLRPTRLTMSFAPAARLPCRPPDAACYTESERRDGDSRGRQGSLRWGRRGAVDS
jgi:hypothetical protein